MAITTNKMFLDKTGLTTFWGIIKTKFATKAETIASVAKVDASDKATLQFTYADNTAEKPHTSNIVINAVNETNAGLMTPTMLSQLNTAVSGTIANLELNYNSTTKKLQLFDGAVADEKLLTEIDATAFVKDGMLNTAELVVNPADQAAGTYLKLVWNTDAGKTEPMYVNVTNLIDVYKAGTNISIDDNKVISCTYSLPVANDTTLGGIKTGYTESGKNYAVKVDNDGKAYVAVPWENTEYSATVQNSNLVKLGLADTAFSIDESALTTRLSEIDTAVKAKVESVDKNTENSAEELIDITTNNTTTGKEVKICTTIRLREAVTLAEDSIQGVGVLDADKNIIGVEKDNDNNVTLSAGTELKTAIANATNAVKEINIGEVQMVPVNGVASVAHNDFVTAFAMSTEDIEAICI